MKAFFPLLSSSSARTFGRLRPLPLPVTVSRFSSSQNEVTTQKMEADYRALLSGNKIFVDNVVKREPDFFEKLAKGQRPSTLWIGCSDSRVPANTITNSPPGDLFVHRNIANTVVHTDVNLLSVMQYAVDILEVKHIIVVGHYGCGGILASMTNTQFGMVDNWLRNLKDEYLLYRDELENISSHKERAERFTELHIKEGVLSVCRTSIVQNAWERRKKTGVIFPHVHGWVFGMKDGLIHDLNVSIRGPHELPLIVRSPIDPTKAM